MKIETHNITTCMGKVHSYFDLPFLNEKEFDEFNNIGYSGKNLNGDKISRSEYLNSLNKGTFKVQQTKSDNGDFTEKFTIIRVIEQ